MVMSITNGRNIHAVISLLFSPGGVLTEVQSKFTDGQDSELRTLSTPPSFLASASECAKSIVDGAARRVDQVYFPWYAGIFCYLRRIWPGAVDMMFYRLVNFYLEHGIMSLD